MAEVSGAGVGRIALGKLDAIEDELRQRGLWNDALAGASLPPFKENWIHNDCRLPEART